MARGVKKAVALYDMNDYPVATFDSYEECEKWLGTSRYSVQSTLTKSKSGERTNHIRDKKTKIVYKVIRIEDEEV